MTMSSKLRTVWSRTVRIVWGEELNSLNLIYINQILLLLSNCATVVSAKCGGRQLSENASFAQERIFFVELPVPALGDLSEVTLLAQRLHRGNPAKLNHTYSDICNLDTIEVNLVPEKKGIFLKHVEYQVTSKVLPGSRLCSYKHERI